MKNKNLKTDKRAPELKRGKPVRVQRVVMRHFSDAHHYKPGEPMKLNWKKQILRAICCDCALVHNVKFSIRGDTLILRAWRNNRMTTKLRVG